MKASDISVFTVIFVIKRIIIKMVASRLRRTVSLRCVRDRETDKGVLAAAAREEPRRR